MIADASGGSRTLRVRSLETLGDLNQCVALQRATWGDDFRELVPPAMLLVARKVGGVLVGAFAEMQLVGFVFGLTGWVNGRPMHWSHMMAVQHDWRDRGVGHRLKGEQRRRLLAAGVDRAQWTFDPLVARNAFFNLERLGTRVLRYVPDMYGDNPMSRTDSVIGSDRFIVEWDLRRDLPSGARPPDWATEGPLIMDSPDVNASLPPHPVVRVAIPPDIQRIKAADPDLAQRWRAGTRQALEHYLREGHELRGFVRSPEGGGHYRLERHTDGRD